MTRPTDPDRNPLFQCDGCGRVFPPDAHTFRYDPEGPNADPTVEFCVECALIRGGMTPAS